MKIIIVTPVLLLGEGLATALQAERGIEVVRVLQHAAALLDLQESVAADMVLIDVAGGLAFDEIRAVAVARPHLKLVALGLPEEQGEVILCARAGFGCYVA